VSDIQKSEQLHLATKFPIPYIVTLLRQYDSQNLSKHLKYQTEWSLLSCIVVKTARKLTILLCHYLVSAIFTFKRHRHISTWNERASSAIQIQHTVYQKYHLETTQHNYGLDSHINEEMIVTMQEKDQFHFTIK